MPRISMPRTRTSLARGVVSTLGTPVLLIAPIAYLFVLWVVLVSVGYEGPFASLATALSLPPIGTSFDATIATSLFGLQAGLAGIVLFLALRAIVLSFLTAAVVETLDTGQVSRSGFRAGLRALPVTFATCVIGVAVLTLTTSVGPLLGPGLGILLQVGGLAAGLYLFVFAPIIGVAEGRSMPEALGRSIRAARIPGTGNLGLAALYVLASIAVIVSPGKPGNLIGVNPTVGAWVFVLTVNLLHVALLATFAFRYLSIAHEVPEARPRPSRAASARGRR